MPSTYGEGIAAGVNTGINGLLGFMRQNTYQDYADMQKKRQAAELGMLSEEDADDQGIVPPASILAANRQAAPSPTPAGTVKKYAGPSMIGMGEPANEPMEMGTAPQPTPQAQPQAAAQGPYDFESMDPEEIRKVFSGIGQRRRESELNRMNTLDMLRPAFHYREKLNEAKPYMDMLAQSIREVRANPTNPKTWKTTMAIMNIDDPNDVDAIEMAAEEVKSQYLDYQKKYTDLTSKFNTLSQSLASQGITPEMYGDEEKFIQLQNELQYRGRRKRTRPNPGAAVLGRPNLRQR